MAYEDPYFGPGLDTDDTTSDLPSDLPPEAAASPNRIGLIIALAAGALVVIGLIVGLLAGRSSNNRD